MYRANSRPSALLPLVVGIVEPVRSAEPTIDAGIAAIDRFSAQLRALRVDTLALGTVQRLGLSQPS